MSWLPIMRLTGDHEHFGGLERSVLRRLTTHMDAWHFGTGTARAAIDTSLETGRPAVQRWCGRGRGRRGEILTCNCVLWNKRARQW